MSASPRSLPVRLPMRFRSECARWGGLLLSCLALSLGACGDDPVDPPTHEGVDGIVFEVYRSDLEGAELLVWRGTAAGPLADSPERTPIPSIGFGQSFRVQWAAESATAPIVGTKILASSAPGARYLALGEAAGEGWGRGTSFHFANEIPASGLEGIECESGPGCPELLRFDAGLCSLSVRAIDRDGRQLEERIGVLRYRVNFAPAARWVVDAADPDRAPYWTTPALDGGTLRRAFAPGDTLPSGARLHLLLRGQDRLFGQVRPDSACCDQRLDPAAPSLRFQARALAQWRRPPATSESRQTFYGVLAPDSLLSMLVGPFEYRLSGRVADEHDERSPAAEFVFFGGLSPRLTEMQPFDGAAIELLTPGEPIPVDGNGPRYALKSARFHWNAALRDWTEFAGEGVQWQGMLYQISLRLRAQPHPVVAQISPSSGGDTTDHVRSIAYELVGEFDPFNRRLNGRGDDIDFFLDVTSAEALDLDDGAGYALFVPDFFWQQPSFFAPEVVGESGCVSPDLQMFCDMGERMRADLGHFVFRARGSAGAVGTSFPLLPPLPADSTGVEIPVEYQRAAIRTPIREQQFSVRLRVPIEGGTVLWPPEAGPAR